LLPVLVIASLVLLELLIAVMRAAASSRGDERGFVCFLSKLGVQIGGGCGSSSAGSSSSSKQAVKQALGELVEHTPRVKDIEPSIPTSGSVLKPDGSVGAAAAGRQRHLTARPMQWMPGAAANAGLRRRALQHR
jgi:hypothetical protein